MIYPFFELQRNRSFFSYLCFVILRSEPLSTILEQHRVMVLPRDKFDRARVIVRRSNILTDSLHLLRNGLDVSKYLRVTFVNEPAVDEGGH